MIQRGQKVVRISLSLSLVGLIGCAADTKPVASKGPSVETKQVGQGDKAENKPAKKEPEKKAEFKVGEREL